MNLETENEQLRTRMGEMAAEVNRLSHERQCMAEAIGRIAVASGDTRTEFTGPDLLMVCGDAAEGIKHLTAENARLQSVIDEANAQKPSFYLWQHKSGKFAHGFYECEEHAAGDWKSFSADGKSVPFYARPIPAQQYAAITGTNEYGLDMGYLSEKLNILLRDISRHTPSEAARFLARLSVVADEKVLAEPEFVKQFPVVAVPDEGELRRIFEEYYADDRFPIQRDAFGDYFENDQRGRTLNNDWDEWKRCRKAMLDIVSNQDAVPSPRTTEQDDKTISSNTSEWSQRVTEQDALAIAESLGPFFDNITQSFDLPAWHGRVLWALLDKLNGDKNGK